MPSTDGSLNPPCSVEMCPSFAITDDQRLTTLSSMVNSFGDNCALTLQSSLMLTQTVQGPHFETRLILPAQRMPHSLMRANMLSMLKQPSSRPQSTKSQMMHFAPCLTNSKKSTFEVSSLSLTSQHRSARFGHALRNCCGTNDLATHVMNTFTMHTNMSLVSPSLTARPLCLTNVPHASKQSRQKFLLDRIQPAQQHSLIKVCQSISASQALPQRTQVAKRTAKA